MKKYYPEFRLNYQPPHYTLLTVAMETGVIGGAFYFLLITMPVLTFILRWREYSSRPFVMGVFALLLAITVVGFFDYYTWLYAPGRLWQWLAWGIWSTTISAQGAV